VLSQFYDKSPDLITEQKLQNYFPRRKNVHHWSSNTIFPSIHRSNTPIDMDALPLRAS
jgi:hypothetical protein